MTFDCQIGHRFLSFRFTNMLRLLVLAAVASPICSRPGFRSSVMHGEKPILRMGPNEAQEEGQDLKLKEPEWVTNLRSNIQTLIKDAGFEAAKPDIKNLIEEANQAVNGNSDEQRYPESHVPIREPLRSRPYKGQTTRLSWERDLKSYIKELIATYGRTNLDRYVRPIVNSIEKAHHIKIHDIDVNPYGDITVNYVRSNENPNFPDPRSHIGRLSPRFTIAPDDRRK